MLRRVTLTAETGEDFVLGFKGKSLVKVNGDDPAKAPLVKLIELLTEELDAARIEAGMKPVRKANRGRKITESEFRRLWFDRTMTLKDIGKELGITGEAVKARAGVRGLPRRSVVGRSKVRAQLEKILRDLEFPIFYRMGVSQADLTKHYGYKSYRPVFQAIDELKLGRRMRPSKWDKISIQQARVRMAVHRVTLTKYGRDGILTSEVKSALWDMEGVRK